MSVFQSYRGCLKNKIAEKQEATEMHCLLNCAFDYNLKLVSKIYNRWCQNAGCKRCKKIQIFKSQF